MIPCNCKFCVLKRELDAANALLREAEVALEPFERAADAVDHMDPEAPQDMAALRPSFDYWTRHVGRDNDEIVDRDSVRLSDLHRAASLSAKISTYLKDGR